MTISTLKRCRKCGEEKPIDLFCKRKNSKDGFENRCKQCLSFYRKKYNTENNERVKGYLKKSYYKNKEAHKLWEKENRHKTRGYYKKVRDKLADGYVARVLVRHMKIRVTNIPTELIEIKRLQITLFRLIKEKQAAA